MLKNAFEGNFLGAKLSEIKSDSTELSDLFRHTRHAGLVVGIPSRNEEDSNLEGKDFQSIERLADTLSDTVWQLVIVAEAGSDEDTAKVLEQIYELSTQLSPKVKVSEQQSENQGTNSSKTKGTSENITGGTNESEAKAKSWDNNEGGSKTQKKRLWR